MAELDYSELVGQIAVNLPSTGSSFITAELLREVVTSMIDSLLFEAGITFEVTTNETDVTVTLVPAEKVVSGEGETDEEGAQGLGPVNDSYSPAQGNVPRMNTDPDEEE